IRPRFPARFLRRRHAVRPETPLGPARVPRDLAVVPGRDPRPGRVRCGGKPKCRLATHRRQMGPDRPVLAAFLPPGWGAVPAAVRGRRRPGCGGEPLQPGAYRSLLRLCQVPRLRGRPAVAPLRPAGLAVHARGEPGDTGHARVGIAALTKEVPMSSLAGRVAVITGSSRGIGRALALGLARHGCHIVVAAKSTASTERLPGSIYTV